MQCGEKNPVHPPILEILIQTRGGCANLLMLQFTDGRWACALVSKAAEYKGLMGRRLVNGLVVVVWTAV